jgi:fumarate hydratase class II
VHPNDHVNASQSSNDVFPTAMRLAAGEAVARDVLPALEHLADALARKGSEFADVVKAGRTHLMDAVPVTLGQEFDGYAAQVEEARERFRDTLPRVLTVPLGGTAVGTGLNCPDGFAEAVVAALAERTGLPLRPAPNRMALQAGADALVELSGQTRAAAVALHKIANDLRWMGSGPGAGLAEIALPSLQPGSSIMPGKVNPVLPEATAQVAAQVIGADAAVAFAGAQGAFELNTYLPVIARNVLEPLRLLANVARLLADRGVDGITADVETCARHAASSPAIATSLAPRLGYEETAKVVQQAIRERRPIRDVVVERGLLPPEEADRLLDVVAMTKGGLR